MYNKMVAYHKALNLEKLFTPRNLLSLKDWLKNIINISVIGRFRHDELIFQEFIDNMDDFSAIYRFITYFLIIFVIFSLPLWDSIRVK